MRRVVLTVGLFVVLAAVPAGAEAEPDCANPRTPQEVVQCRGTDRNEDEPGTETPNTTRTPAAETTADDAGDDGFPILWVVVALVLGVAAGYGLARALAPKSSPAAAPVAAMPAPSAPAAPGDRQRDLLVRQLVDLRDRVGSDALAEEIRVHLEHVGVREIAVPIGDPFDPNLQRGVDSRPTDDPSLDQRIAAVERPGYRDGAIVLRLPDVVVYRSS